MKNSELVEKLRTLSNLHLKNNEQELLHESHRKLVFFNSEKNGTKHELNFMMYVPSGNILLHHYIREFSKYLDLGGLLEVAEYNYEENSIRVIFDNISFKSGWLSEYTIFGNTSNVDSKDLFQKLDYLIVEEI